MRVQNNSGRIMFWGLPMTDEATPARPPCAGRARDGRCTE